MKIVSACFLVAVDANRLASVSWDLTDRTLVVHLDGKRFELEYLDNKKRRRWKPCATHAAEVVAMVLGRATKSNQSKQRLQASRPRLSVVNREEGVS